MEIIFVTKSISSSVNSGAESSRGILFSTNLTSKINKNNEKIAPTEVNIAPIKKLSGNSLNSKYR